MGWFRKVVFWCLEDDSSASSVSVSRQTRLFTCMTFMVSHVNGVSLVGLYLCSSDSAIASFDVTRCAHLGP